MRLSDFAGRERTPQADLGLGLVLAAVAGAANAGGFLAVSRYTSHMTGVVSSISDDLALGRGRLALAGLGMLLAFTSGAGACALLVNWARRRGMRGAYALPLLAESALMLAFGALGAAPAAVAVLCFMMGLQNAIVTKVSDARVRTTHVTGLVTDLGIELGRLLYWNRDRGLPGFVAADRRKLRVHAATLASFFLGGAAGASAFKRLGFVFAAPLALVLLALAAPPLLEDARAALRPH